MKTNETQQDKKSLGTQKENKEKKLQDPAIKKESSILDYSLNSENLGKSLIEKYLDKTGYEILECDWICMAGMMPFIARMDETVVFIDISVRTDSFAGFPSTAYERPREWFEKIAACYLKNNPLPSGVVRFDVIAIITIGKNRGFLRHHKDAFN